jgi:shikimate kinase
MKIPANVILVGFMGAGKTSTGKELARILKFDFWDMDQWIEDKNGKKVSEIFKEKGEIFFRAEEKAALLQVGGKERRVLSTGGGVWLDEENRARLLASGWCVWLKVSAEKAWQRIGPNVSQRPLLAQSTQPLKTLEDMLAARSPYYSMAHACFNTDGKSPREVANEIFEVLKKELPFDLPELQK